jgi:cytochrome c553
MRFGFALAAALLAAGTFATPAAAQTASAATAPDLAKGQKLAGAVCAACHGPDGNATAPANPKLAGQIPEYLVKQLINFKPGANGRKPERENAIMMGFASTLSAQDMKDVAAFYASQKLIPDTAKDKNTIGIGQRIWRGGVPEKGVPACAGCHGPAGQGMPSQYPHLAGQWSEYTEAQMKAWRSGERANDPNGMMRAIAARLSDAEIRAVSDFAAGLR